MPEPDIPPNGLLLLLLLAGKTGAVLVLKRAGACAIINDATNEGLLHA